MPFMSPEIIENILKALTPVALAIAWIWTQLRSKNKDDDTKKLDIADRERQYSERTEARLARAQEELESVMKELEGRENPEQVLQEVVERDPGLMFVKKRIAPKMFVYLKVSKGYGVTYLGGPSEIIEGRTENLLGWDFSSTDEAIYNSQEGKIIVEPVFSPITGIRGTFRGRKFPLTFGVNNYIVGVGDHELDKEA
jgi:hypothetical protein